MPMAKEELCAVCCKQHAAYNLKYKVYYLQLYYLKQIWQGFAQ